MNRRKGTALDLIFIIVVMIVFAIVTIVSVYLGDKIFTPLQTMFGAGDATDVMNTTKAAFGVMDYIFLFLFFGLCMTPIVFAFLVNTHPIFFVVNLLILIVMLFIMPTLSNLVRDIWSNAEFAPYAAGGSAEHTFPIMTYVFKYLPLISVGMTLILTIAMFVKGREL